MERLVVVGASLAGLRAAQAARNAGFEGELVVIGDEPHMPYTRPPLSKELLAGVHDVERTGFPLGKLQAEWRLGTAAARLDRDRHRVDLADEHHTEVEYDRLIVATGCRARPYTGPGADLKGVHLLRGLDDALALRDALEPGKRLVVLGAGFVGCEVAATARSRGLQVTLVDIAELPMLPLGPELGEWCAELHRSHGVELHLGVGIAALEGGERGDRCVEAVELQDGTVLPADVVLVGFGAIPNVEWLAGSGLTIDDGLACDGTLTTLDDPDVLGAGDVISWPHPLASGEVIRIEHWTVAAEQGTLAGRNALRDPPEREPHTAPPYFWSDQYDVKLQAVGLPARADHPLELLEASPDGTRRVYAGERDGRVVGVVAINAVKRLIRYRRALADPPSLDDLRDIIAADPGALGAQTEAA